MTLDAEYDILIVDPNAENPIRNGNTLDPRIGPATVTVIAYLAE